MRRRSSEGVKGSDGIGFGIGGVAGEVEVEMEWGGECISVGAGMALMMEEDASIPVTLFTSKLSSCSALKVFFRILLGKNFRKLVALWFFAAQPFSLFFFLLLLLLLLLLLSYTTPGTSSSSPISYPLNLCFLHAFELESQTTVTGLPVPGSLRISLTVPVKVL